jgi:hypothetical protein
MKKVDIEHALEYWDDILLADGFNDAIVGIHSDTGVVYYSKEAVIQILIQEHGMSDIDAMEYADYNVFGAYVGEKTPIFLEDFFIEQ